MKIIFYTLLLYLNCNLFAQSNESAKRPKSITSSEAYGYLLGQDYTLQKIKKQLPQFEIQIISAELMMKTAFGKSKDNLISYFKKNFTNEKLKELELSINENFEKATSNFYYSEQDAKNTIKELEERSKGKIPSPVLETLLSFQYLDNPKDEFLAGYNNLFSTKNHVKAKNTEWSIKVPKSWTAKEGDGLNIIQKFVDDCGNGNNMVSMITQELPTEEIEKNLTPKEIEKFYTTDFFVKENVKDFLPENVSFLSFTPMKISSCPGALVTYETIHERLGLKFKIRVFQFFFQKNSYLHFLNCTIGTPDINEDLTVKAKIFFPLYQLIANSIKTFEKDKNVIYLKGNETQKIVDVRINEKKYDFILDTGASTSLISKSIIKELIQKKIITSKNYVRKDYVKLADGRDKLVEFWRLPNINIGIKKIIDVTFAVIDDDNLTPLLGMNILNKLSIWKIDLENNKIYLLE